MRGDRTLLVLLLAVAMYGWNFWGTPVYMLDEAKNAGCAAEMLRTSNYVIPVFNGEFHDKPVLQYYFMMAAYSVGGINGFTARLGSVLCGILMVLVFYRQVTRFTNERTAFLSAAMVISSLQLSYQFKMAVPDPYLLASLVIGFLFFYRGFKDDDRKSLWLFYACVALGFLAKGPIAIVLPGLSILLFLIFERRLSWRALQQLQLFPGIAIFLVIASPWYLLVGIQTDWKWPEYFFITHNLSRYVSTFEGHRGFPFDTVVIVLSALLPLSVFAPQALRSAWKQRREKHFLMFCFCCCIAVVGFFLFSKTVLPSYPSPSIPFAAVLLACYFDRVLRGDEKMIGSTASVIILLIISLAVPVVAFFALKNELPQFANYAWFFIVLPAGALASIFLVRSNRLQPAFFTMLGAFMLTQMLAFSFVLPAVYNSNPVTQSLKHFPNDKKPAAYFATINSAYVFEMNTIIPRLSTEQEVVSFAETHPGCIIVSTRNDWSRLVHPPGKIIFEGKDLFESPVTVLVAFGNPIQ